MLEELCCIFWSGFYGIYCLCMCGTYCKEEYEARIKKRERILTGFSYCYLLSLEHLYLNLRVHCDVSVFTSITLI